MKLPVILLVFVDAFGFFWNRVFPVWVVADKKRQPQAPGKTHKPRLQSNQCGRIKHDPYKEPLVFKGEADRQEPDQAADAGHGQGDQVTYVAGTVIKADLDIGWLTTNRTAFVHFHISPDANGCRILKQHSFPATWAAASHH